MTKAYFLPLTLFFLIVGCQISDSDSPNPEDTFIKYYGESGAQEGDGLIYLQDTDEIIIYGSQLTVDGSNTDLFLLRVDAQGNELQSATFNFPSPFDSLNGNNAVDDTPGSLRYIAGTGFLYTGTSTRFDAIAENGTFNALTWAIITDDFEIANDSSAVGEVMGVSTDVDPTAAVEFKDIDGKDIILLESGNLRVTGSSTLIQLGDELVTNNPNDKQIYIADIDPSTGEILNQTTIGFEGNDEAFYIDEFSTGNFAIIGTTERRLVAEGRNVIVIPTDENLSPNDGLIASFTGAGIQFNEDVTDVIKKSGGYVVVGTSSQGPAAFPFFMNIGFNSTGGATLENADTVMVTIDDVVANALGGGVVLGANGNYALVGAYSSFPEKNSEIMITQTSQSGNNLSEFQRNYGLTSGNDAADDVLLLPDGSLVILSTVDFGSGNTLLGLLKTNRDGDLLD